MSLGSSIATVMVFAIRLTPIARSLRHSFSCSFCATTVSTMAGESMIPVTRPCRRRVSISSSCEMRPSCTSA